jgi:hypothetical protein
MKHLRSYRTWFCAVGLIATSGIAQADGPGREVIQSRVPVENIDDLILAPRAWVIPCPPMLLTAAPDGATNGFNSKGFLIGTAGITASVGVAGPYTFLYCSANYFGGAWIFQQAPAGYTCTASGSSFTCVR